MEVILRQDVEKVGLRGEVVDVAPGFARNYLLPRKLAETATPAKVAELRKLEHKRARHEAQSFEQAQEIAQRLEASEIRFDVPAGETGTLFGSVTATDVAERVWETQKVRIDRRKLDLADSIKRIGRYQIPLELFADVTATLRLAVVPEGGELPPQEELDAIAAAEAEAEAAAQAEAEAEHAQAEAEIDAVVAEEDAEAEAEETPDAAEEPQAEQAPDDASDGTADATDDAGDRPEVTNRAQLLHRQAGACGFRAELPARSALFTHRCRPGVLGTCVPLCLQTGCCCPVRACRKCRRPDLPRPRRELLDSAMAQLAQASQTAPVPPQNLEAEESVLGAMMLSPGAIGAVSEVLDASDFYRESHAVIYRAALALYAKGEPVDAITLVDELEERGELEAAGGRVRIHELAALVPASANAGHYARIVREMATLRGLIRAGGEIAQLGWERPGETTDLVDRAEQVVFDLSQARVSSEFSHIEELLKDSFERITALYEAGADVTGTPSGFRDLDRLTSGFQPGNLIIVAARPSMGKSGLGLCMAANLAVRAEVPTALFTLEMSKAEVTQRLMCSEAKVESQRLRTGKLGADDWPRLTAACDRLAKAPIYVDDQGSITMMEIRSKARRLKSRESDLGLIIVDYLQLMTSGSNVESRVQEVSQISRSLKVLARDLDVPILAMSQLSRAVEQRHDKRPILSDLRESGSIEQDADLVMFIYRDEYYNDESDQQGLAEVHLAKHRNGPTDTVKLSFLKRYAKFADLAAAQ